MKKKPANQISKTNEPIDKSEANYIDKIIKENLDAVSPMLLDKIAKLKLQSVEIVRSDLQRTKEVVSDSLKIAVDENGNKFILHDEFQVKDDPDMAHRMLLYCAMMMRKFKLPVRQFVFFLSDNAPNMATNLSSEDLFFRYNLFHINEFSYKIFQETNKPEDIVFSVLGSFDGKNDEEVAKDIIQRIGETAPTEIEKKKFFQQLILLSRLRNLQPLIENIMQNISHYIDAETDYFYLKGKEKGKEEGIEEGIEKGIDLERKTVVANLLLENTFSVEKIANIANVSESFVIEIQKELKMGKKKK